MVVFNITIAIQTAPLASSGAESLVGDVARAALAPDVSGDLSDDAHSSSSRTTAVYVRGTGIGCGGGAPLRAVPRVFNARSASEGGASSGKRCAASVAASGAAAAAADGQALLWRRRGPVGTPRDRGGSAEERLPAPGHEDDARRTRRRGAEDGTPENKAPAAAATPSRPGRGDNKAIGPLLGLLPLLIKRFGELIATLERGENASGGVPNAAAPGAAGSSGRAGEGSGGREVQDASHHL